MRETFSYPIKFHPRSIRDRMKRFNKMLKKKEIINLKSKCINSDLTKRMEFIFEYKFTPIFYLRGLSNN